MKKVIYSVAIVATMILASCGGPSMCDCMNMEKDDAKLKEPCEKMEKEMKEKYDKATDEEKEEMMKEMEACEKKDEKK